VSAGDGSVIDPALGRDHGTSGFGLVGSVPDHVDRHDGHAATGPGKDDTSGPESIVVTLRLTIRAEARHVDRVRVVDRGGLAERFLVCRGESGAHRGDVTDAGCGLERVS
jgi:hypothetical protein